MSSAHSRPTRRERRREADAQPEPDYRFTLANERTLLAYLRTSMAISAGGAGVLVFGTELPRVVVGPSAVVLGLAAAVVALAALGRWRANETAIRMRAALPRPRLLGTFAVGVAVCIGLAVAAVSVVELARGG